MKKILKKKTKKSLLAVRYFTNEFVNIGALIPISLDNGITYTHCQITCDI